MIVYAISQAKPGINMEDLNPYMQGELNQGWKMLKEGITRDIHLRSDAIGVVIKLEVDNVEQAKQYCENFPLAVNKIIEFTYIPVAPFTLWEFMK